MAAAKAGVRLLSVCTAAALLLPATLLLSAAQSARADPPARGSWIGRTQQELLAQRGEPASVRVRPDGSLLLEYVFERDGRTCRGVYLADPFGVIAAEKEECEAGRASG
jgi:hypothetical protein